MAVISKCVIDESTAFSDPATEQWFLGIENNKGIFYHKYTASRNNAPSKIYLDGYESYENLDMVFREYGPYAISPHGYEDYT